MILRICTHENRTVIGQQWIWKSTAVAIDRATVIVDARLRRPTPSPGNVESFATPCGRSLLDFRGGAFVKSAFVSWFFIF